MRQQHSGWKHLVWSDWCARLGFDSQTDHMTPEDKEVEAGLHRWWHIPHNMGDGWSSAEPALGSCGEMMPPQKGLDPDTTPYCPKCFAIQWPGVKYHP